MSKRAKALAGASLLGLGLQALMFAGGIPHRDVGVVSNLAIICLSCLAGLAAFDQARAPNIFARRFWLLTGSSFFLLTAALSVGTYYENVVRASLDSLWPSDLLYFLFVAPMAMTLFRRGRDPEFGVNWAQVFDVLQVGILVTAVYLYYFYLPSHWRGHGPEMLRLQWKVEAARDIFLIAAFAFRFTLVRSGLEWSLLWRLGWFFGLFSLGSNVFLYRQKAAGLHSGTWWDFCYTLPLAASVIASSTWSLPASSMEDADKGTVRREPWGSLWMSAILPLLVLGVASRMTHERPLLATIVVVTTLAAAGVRIVLTQYRQQQLAEAMVEAEQKFRLLFQYNPQPTCLYEPVTGRFLEVNQAATEKYGYSREEFLRLRVADVCLGLSPERLEAAQRGVEFRDEIWRHRKKDGSILDVLLFARTIEYGGQSARLVVAQDMTERRHSEELQSALYRIAEVSTSARDLAGLYPAIHVIVADLLDARNFYIALYDEPANWLTFPYFVDEFENAPSPKAPHKGLTEYVLRTGQPLLATGDKLNELAELGEVQREGSPADDWLGVPLKQGEKTFGVLAVQHYAARTHFGEREKEVLTFVSHQVASAILRKRNEEALLRSELRYRSLVQSAVVGIFRATLEGRFLDVNPALVAMLGYSSAAELLKLDLQRDVFVEDRARATLRRSFLRHGRFDGVEAVWRRKDGAAITVRLSGRGLRDEREGAEIFEVIAEDVTERKALEEQLRQAQKMEAVGTLAGGVAHDFNNLLTVVTGYSQLLMEQHAGDPQTIRSIEQIYRAADRATSLTRQLLAFSRRQILQPRIVSLNHLAKNVEKMLQPLLGERIQIVLRTALDLGTVKADPGQVEHILMNLAVNARDAMPRGGTVTIETRNVVLGADFARVHAGAEPGRYVALSVSDTGVGMDPRVLAHVFEPFFTTKEPGKGTGLGLSMVYGIVKQSGGYITVDSELGRGTTFSVYLPRVDEVDEFSVPETSSVGRQQGSGTVLVVEDELAVRALVEQILASQGYQVLVADSAVDAVTICREHDGVIDVVLTDVVMPGISGPELVKELLLVRAGMKIVYMSGYAPEYLIAEGVSSDGVAHLPKPFTAAALQEKIRQVLQSPVAF